MTGWLRARLRAADRTDAGMTLVELLIAMFITSILLAAVASVFAGTMKNVRVVNTKAATTADGRIAMEAITRTIRVAFQPSNQVSALALANTNTLSFYALINRTGVNTSTPLPSLIEYGWDGTCLTEAQTPGRLNASSILVWDTGRVNKCLARTTIKPVFAYYLTGNATTPLTVPGTGLAAATLQTVQSIQVTVNVQDATNPSITGVPFTDRVTMINVQTKAGG